MFILQIPRDWNAYVSFSFNRIFINPASGCFAQCKYCYIYDYGHPCKPKLFDVSVKILVDWIVSQHKFRVGKNGTLISIGSSCDPFAPGVKEKTIELLEELVPLGNPIQISSKFEVDEFIIKRISELKAKKGQILLFFTLTTFKYWRDLEPNAPDPKVRLLGMKLAREQGLNTCLYVKPVLLGVTNKEVEIFSDVIREYGIELCTIGIIYASASILNRLSNCNDVVNVFSERNAVWGDRPPPSKKNENNHVASNIDQLDIIKSMIPVFEKAGAKCTINSVCAISMSYDILCPTGIWQYLPELCVSCGVTCGKRFDEMSLENKSLYPSNYNPFTNRN